MDDSTYVEFLKAMPKPERDGIIGKMVSTIKTSAKTAITVTYPTLFPYIGNTKGSTNIGFSDEDGEIIVMVKIKLNDPKGVEEIANLNKDVSEGKIRSSFFVEGKASLFPNPVLDLMHKLNDKVVTLSALNAGVPEDRYIGRDLVEHKLNMDGSITIIFIGAGSMYGLPQYNYNIRTGEDVQKLIEHFDKEIADFKPKE